jgi:hypothetical protein
MTQNEDVMPLEELVNYLSSHYADVDVMTYPPEQPPTAWFFSRDADKHWPNFATIVTTDEHDTEPNSNLAARGAYRLNVGVGRESFERLIDLRRQYDYTATDEVLPHPTYAKQRWIGIVNPTRRTFDDVLKALLEEAYDRLRPPRGADSNVTRSAHDPDPDAEGRIQGLDAAPR